MTCDALHSELKTGSHHPPCRKGTYARPCSINAHTLSRSPSRICSDPPPNAMSLIKSYLNATPSAKTRRADRPHQLLRLRRENRDSMTETYVNDPTHFPAFAGLPCSACLTKSSTSCSARRAIASSYPRSAGTLNARFHGRRRRACSRTSTRHTSWCALSVMFRPAQSAHPRAIFTATGWEASCRCRHGDPIQDEEEAQEGEKSGQCQMQVGHVSAARGRGRTKAKDMVRTGTFREPVRPQDGDDR